MDWLEGHFYFHICLIIGMLLWHCYLMMMALGVDEVMMAQPLTRA